MDDLDDLLSEMKPSKASGAAPNSTKQAGKWAPVNASKNKGPTGAQAGSHTSAMDDLDNLSLGFGGGEPAAKYGDDKYKYEKREGGSQHEDALAALLGGMGSKAVAYSDQKVERNLNPTKEAVSNTKKALMQSASASIPTRSQERVQGISGDVSHKKEVFKQSIDTPIVSKTKVEGISGDVGAKKALLTSTNSKAELKPVSNGTKQHLYDLINKEKEKKICFSSFWSRISGWLY